jgi:regulator of cell morphogenesis and NO signaling
MPPPNTPVGQLVADRPDRARIFEQLRIDYCCGGDRTLAEACRSHDLDPGTVAQMLDPMADASEVSSAPDWTEVELGTLIDHIVDTHHDFLRRELPRLRDRIATVLRAHGDEVEWLQPMQDRFHTLQGELKDHMANEEDYVFPAIRTLEQGRVLPDGSTLDPDALEQMMNEHDEVSGILARLRTLTNDYTPPADACAPFRAALDGLKELEADTHQHIHKENNILFSRARRLA